MSQTGASECIACKRHADTTNQGLSQSEPFKRCSGCKAVWYCSQKCQQEDWVRHIFACNSGQTITSAHHLALAVHDNIPPQDKQTLLDYGFSRAANAPAQYDLLRLYRDLIKRLGISPKTIRKWSIGNCLVDQVAAAYSKLPIDSRGTHYYWFLGNKSILDGSAAEGELDIGLSGSFKKARDCASCGVCERDDEEESAPPLKQCAGCKKVRYCSSQCQKNDWARHKLDCTIKPGHTITTADRLARAVHEDLLPEDQQTSDDYGFTRAWASDARAKLLGVYAGLIKLMRIPAKEIHRWRVEGRLLQEIRKAYEQLPPYARGFYPWLMENQYILDTSLPSPRSDPQLDMLARGLKYARIPVPQSSNDVPAIIEKLPISKRECLYLATLVLTRNHPSPSDENAYVAFGFCACADVQEESQFSVRWRRLLDLCTFEDLCDAYSSSSLLRLFESKGLPISNPAIIDVLRRCVLKSVWHLKQFVLGTDDSKVQPIVSVCADYGFMNCTTDAERLGLKSIYKVVFSKKADPLLLHKACLAGKLSDFVGGYYKVSGKKREKYDRLFWNMYPAA